MLILIRFVGLAANHFYWYAVLLAVIDSVVLSVASREHLVMFPHGRTLPPARFTHLQAELNYWMLGELTPRYELRMSLITV